MIATLPTITTHNGIFTITSVKTGEHRTFRVRTQKPEASFAPGSRVIGLLVGPDNTRDYKGFGFVGDNGQIHLWRKNQTPTFQAYAKMLEGMENHIDAGNIHVDAATKCRKCNRPLTTPQSVSSGIGPICESKE